MKFFAFMLCLLSPTAFAECVLPAQEGALIWTADTIETCSGYWMIPATDYAAYVSALQITPQQLLAAFTWGFGTVVMLGALSYKVRIALEIIRKS